MPSLMAALQAGEDEVRASAAEVRAQLEVLSAELAAAEEQLVRLRITRETVEEVLSSPVGPVVPPGVVLDVEAAVLPQVAELVPVLMAAEAAGDMTVTSEPYRRILIVFAEASGPLRCKDVCVGVGLGTEANHTEGMRGKLKKLVGRGILAEVEPGLFALAGRAGAR